MPSFASTESARSSSEPEATDLPLRQRNTTMPLAESERWPERRYHRHYLRALPVEREQSAHDRQLHTFAARAYQLRHVAQRLCSQRPRPVVPGKNVCERHLRHRQERYLRLKAPGKAREA